jgi:translation elongation factor EF-G
LLRRTLNLGILAHVDAGKTTLTERLLYRADFIAEVERVLSVLDGAVLVISAVEGMQPQTRLLMRALKRLYIPTLLFVNKIDRTGAGYERVLEAISERLTPATVTMGAVEGLGTRAGRFLPWGADDTADREGADASRLLRLRHHRRGRGAADDGAR